MGNVRVFTTAHDRPGRVGRDHGHDHDPDVLDAIAARLDDDARILSTWSARDLDVRRLVADLRSTAALLHRFADDLRLVERFLREARLLAPEDDQDDDQDDRTDRPA